MNINKQNIEEARIDYHDDGDLLLVNGWAYSDYQEYASFQLYKNGDLFQDIKVEKVHREDVNSYYKKLPVDADIGFRITANLNRIQFSDSFELRADNCVLWNSTGEELRRKYMQADIYYGIDHVKAINNIIRVNGWAISKRESDINIQIKDEKNHDIPFQKEILLRMDSSFNVFGDDRKKDCGFQLDIDRSKAAGKLKLILFSDCEIKEMDITETEYVVENVSNKVKLPSKMKLLFQNDKESFRHEWKIKHSENPYSYDIWYEKNKLSKQELEKQRNTVFSYMPKVSIIMNTSDDASTGSVKRQSYSNWEICKSIDESKGDILCFLENHDELSEDALFEVVKRFNADETIDIVYSDEDKITKEGSYFDPQFKSDFNIDFLRSNNYINHLFVIKRNVVDQIGEVNHFNYDLILRCVETAQNISHISKILYHCHAEEMETDHSDTDIQALQSHLVRMHEEGIVERTKYLGYYKTTYKVKGDPLISIIIPNKDHVDILKKCLMSIFERSTYENFEIIIVENNSVEKETFNFYEFIQRMNDKIKVVTWQGEGFNYSSLNNFGTKYAKGEYLILLNNDIEVITPDWIERMLGTCQRKDVGIVGAKLLYPDHTIQHCGIILNLGGTAGHMFKNMSSNNPGYFNRAMIQQDVTAVTAACMMVKQYVYEKVGGLEEKLAVAFNDVDFCLKVREQGYLIVLDPNVNLYHYESKTRGEEDSLAKYQRFVKETEFLKDKWKDVFEQCDPYYNNNLSLESDEDAFVLIGKAD